MIIVYCQSPLDKRQPDETYRAEAEASASIGFARRLIDFEALVNEENIEKCLRLEGRLMSIMKYWDEVQYPAEAVSFNSLLNSVASVPSNFFTVDFARLETGEWMIIELGDGQVAGLPDNMDTADFYNALRQLD